ncbi:MAG: restriction endonuclease subunit S [Candidatus Margulisiibacteriota bacterium]
MKCPHVSLGQYCDKIGSGVTPRGGDSVYLNEGVALIRSQNIYNANFTTDGLAYIDEKQAEKMAGVEVMERDVLLNITGDSVARCCLAPSGILPARVNQHVSIIRPKPAELDSKFLTYYLVSPYMQSYMLSWAGSGGTRKALTKTMIENFRVPLPELNTQRAIASRLSAYDDLIENNRRRIKLLEEAARLLYREWFVYFRFPGHEHVKNTNGVPTGWEKKLLGDIVAIKKGKISPPKLLLTVISL